MSEVVQTKIQQDIFTVLHQLMSMLLSPQSGLWTGNSTAISAASQEYITRRIALENVRLWHQLNVVPRGVGGIAGNPATEELFNAFQAGLLAVPDDDAADSYVPSASDPEAADVIRQDNATIVLYFDHLHHATPTNHVENQKRYQTVCVLIRSCIC